MPAAAATTAAAMANPEAALAELAIEPAPPEELDEPPEARPRAGSFSSRNGLMKPLVALAMPGMYLFDKYSQYRREQREMSRRKVTERELQHLHHKIDKLLSKLEENEPEMASSQEDECVICVNARATMQTAPCGHRVVCRRCFVKTIQMAVSQRLLPLRCVICRAKILRLKQTLIPRDYSMSGKSWVLPQSASEYNMSAGVPSGVAGPGGRWSSGNVPASASLYSMASGSSSISGVSSVSSATCSSASSTASSASFGKSRLRHPAYSSFRKNQVHSAQSIKMRIQEYQDLVQAAPVGDEPDASRENRRLPPIKEFQRDFRAGKASTRLRCAQKIVTQLESQASPPRIKITPAPANSKTSPPTSSSSASKPSSAKSTVSSSASTSSSLSTASEAKSTASSSATSSKRPTNSGTTPKKLTVAQQVQLTKKEKEREKERAKAEKARQKEAEKNRLKEAERAEKAEKARQKEAKKLAKEEKKRAKKEAKIRRKEAEEHLLGK
uniref:RING-type domain-containing protein n=1 Tax=Trichogramma kaykai TaxID=54128 RepID=A0ABD2XPQ8_9HYME